MNQINNAHIVEIFDFVAEASRVFCVMEWLEGETLAELLKRQRSLSVAHSANLVRQVCVALHAAHQVGVVHRDVKPENVFLVHRPGEAEFVKVLDFGVAKLTGPAAGPDVQQTTEGSLLGTPRYMSPEQVMGRAVDHRADLWAVGVMLHECLSGKVLFDGRSITELAVQIATRPVPALPDATPTGEPIPPALAGLVRSCLEKSAEDRPASAFAVGEAVAPFASAGERTGPGTAPAPAGFVPSPAPARRAGSKAVLIAFGLALGVAAAWIAATRPGARRGHDVQTAPGRTASSFDSVLPAADAEDDALRSASPADEAGAAASSRRAGGGASPARAAPERTPRDEPPRRPGGKLAPTPASQRRTGSPSAAAAPLSSRQPTGVLQVNCIPWCRIYVDGADTGRNSPARDLELPAGPHRLRLVNPPTGAAQEREVDIAADTKTQVIVRF